MLDCSFNCGLDQVERNEWCQFLPEFLLVGERRWVSWLIAVHPVLWTLTVNHQLQAPGLPKIKIKKSEEIYSPIKCESGKTKRNYSSHTAKTAEKKEQPEQKPMKGGEPIIHCDRTSPLRLQLNPQREQKVQIHLPKSGLPRTWSGEKAARRIQHD